MLDVKSKEKLKKTGKKNLNLLNRITLKYQVNSFEKIPKKKIFITFIHRNNTFAKDSEVNPRNLFV